MKNNVYITGSSLICALGNNKKTSIHNALQINNNNYNEFYTLDEHKRVAFRINQQFNSTESKFYSLIKDALLEAIEDAKLSKDDCEDMAVFIGSTSMSIPINEEQAHKYYNENNPNQIKMIGYGKVATFVEEIVGTKHKAVMLQTACTSTANGIAQASEYIKQGRVKKALVLGFELYNKSTYDGFESLLLMSQSGVYKPFDKHSDGLVLGESCSAVILELDKKNHDDFKILSSYRGFDNYSITGSNPTGEVIGECIEKSLEKANLTINDLTCIKAHATGTEVSNMSEARAIDSVFEKYQNKCDVVILKPYIGHTLGACGTSEIVLLSEFIKNNIIPKTLNFNESLDDITFQPLLENRYQNKGTVLYQFIGFGGSNIVLILSNEDE